MGNYSVTGALPGYSTTTDPTAIENVGPAAGQNWTDTNSAGTNITGFQSAYDRIKAAGDAAAAQPGFSEDKLRARQAAEANALATIKMENDAQAAASLAGQRQATQGAGAAALSTGGVTAKTQPGTMQERAAQRGQARMNTPNPSPAPNQPMQPTTQPTTQPTQPTGQPQIAGQVASNTPQVSTSGVSYTPPTQATPQTPQASPQATAPPPPTPTVNLLRSIAETEQDPITRAILSAQAEAIEANPISDPMGQAAFNTVNGKSIASPYDAIAQILDNARKTAQGSADAKKAFVKDQFERNDSLMALQQQQIQNQLTFANDRAVRDQAETNKKNLDSQTVMLALSGGFGSADGNREIIETRSKGEQAIMDLNKEFGFKRTDVSLQFTQMHNQAFDTYQTAWLEATDNFETKVANLDIQGISNQGAKADALNSAYKSYVSDIKTARKDHATALTEALKYVQEQHNKERQFKYDEKKANSDREWDDYKFGVTTGLEQLRIDNENRRIVQQAEQNAESVAARQDAAADRKDQKSLTSMTTVTNQLNSRINSDPIMKEALAVQPKFNTLKNVYLATVEQQKLYDSGAVDRKTMNFSDQALINNFNKLTDPNSVIRESEFARSADGLSLIQSVSAKVQAVSAGGLLTPEARKELYEVANTLYGSYQDMFKQRSQQYYLQLGQYNANVPPEYQMTPEQFGLPAASTGTTEQYNLEEMAPEGLFPSGNPFSDTPPVSDSQGYQSFKFGDRSVKAAPVMISALARADQAFFADTGRHLDINSDFRSGAQQQTAWDRYQKGEIALAAPPGSSFHEKGMAVDVTNWKEAEQYLIAAGIYPLPKHLRGKDPGHFSIGESSPIS